MNKRKPTVTIGIPAHNEARSLPSLIASLLTQISSGFTLDAIIIYCDACTDRTYEFARALAKNNRKIKVFASAKRMGKGAVLNEIFRLAKSDICVLLDADTHPAHPLMLKRLIDPFRNADVGIVSGNDMPFPEQRVFSRIIATAHDLWFETRKHINGGDSVHNVHGPVYALRKKVFTAMTIPQDIDADDHFAYLTAKSLGFRLVFAKTAQVYFKSPTTMNDYLIQHSRYLRSTDLIIKHFGPSVMPYYRVPRTAKIRALLTVGKRKPVLLLAAVMLQFVLRFLKQSYVENTASRWKTISTTKNITWGGAHAQ